MDYPLRDSGRELGSFSLEQLEAKLADHQIGMMAEVYDDGQWITIADLIEKTDEQRRQDDARRATAAKAAAIRREEKRKDRELELERERERTRQMEIDAKKNDQLASPTLAGDSSRKLSGTAIAGYITVGFALFVACVFWGGIVFTLPLIITISFFTGVTFGSAALILGVTNCFLLVGKRVHGVFQVLGAIICLLLLVVPYVFLEVLLSNFR